MLHSCDMLNQELLGSFSNYTTKLRVCNEYKTSADWLNAQNVNTDPRKDSMKILGSRRDGNHWGKGLRNKINKS